MRMGNKMLSLYEPTHHNTFFTLTCLKTYRITLLLIHNYAIVLTILTIL